MTLFWYQSPYQLVWCHVWSFCGLFNDALCKAISHFHLLLPSLCGVNVLNTYWCFKHLSLIKFFKLFKTLHILASIGHPQVLKLFVKRIAVIFRYSCLFVPLSFVTSMQMIKLGIRHTEDKGTKRHEYLKIIAILFSFPRIVWKAG
jgi:hypothetical protein